MLDLNVSATCYVYLAVQIPASGAPTRLTRESAQVPWAMPSEIFPSSLRAKGVALATCSNWLNNFIIGLITPPLVINTGFGAVRFPFGATKSVFVAFSGS